MRSLARVGLRPSRDHKISFGVQLALVLLWMTYGLFLIFTEPDSSTNDRHFIHYVFLILAFGYLLFILAQNTSVFGQQSYLEITPAYVVEKRGHFKKKVAIHLQDVLGISLNNAQARFTMRDGSKCLVNLKLISSRKGQQIAKAKLMEVADKHAIPVTDTSVSARR
ncbi:hypothetical protein ACFSC6_14835 [Rufibacter sediminis]|uniref:Uncharacterized protein n=1 Tax=Rufibacter sediminis TaxID=2762756 RepID=A0ABR6VVV2_9BACT|nr:hypothetical protein [Rufibacter sediminis]MBC3541310.1 hypothetical protein [Rufibacter sediminis]